MGGSPTGRVHAIRRRLIDPRALLEAEIDLAEDDVSSLTHETIRREMLATAQTEIAAAAARSDTGQLLGAGQCKALVDAPDAGKSSTMNLLLRRNLAIATVEAGTPAMPWRNRSRRRPDGGAI